MIDVWSITEAEALLEIASRTTVLQPHCTAEKNSPYFVSCVWPRERRKQSSLPFSVLVNQSEREWRRSFCCLPITSWSWITSPSSWDKLGSRVSSGSPTTCSSKCSGQISYPMGPLHLPTFVSYIARSSAHLHARLAPCCDRFSTWSILSVSFEWSTSNWIWSQSKTLESLVDCQSKILWLTNVITFLYMLCCQYLVSKGERTETNTRDVGLHINMAKLTRK